MPNREELIIVRDAKYAPTYLLSGIKKATQAGRLPLDMAQGMEELYHNYRDAVCKSGHPKTHDIALSNTTAALDYIYMDVKVIKLIFRQSLV